MTDTTTTPVRQLRLVVEAEDFEAALTFYRDVLGLPQRAAFEGDGDARVAILDAGAATLELANPAQVRMIDGIEAEGTRSARLRVAFEVDDAEARTTDLVAGGAELVASPRQTPWRSLNSRLNGPAGLQLTLFEELDSPGR
ncbi:glyoxalase/bleomycin resistance/dioxygenase family protein [Actinoalloteichus sp. AHMU CJ021]|uniref:VOC family protein n=1 Tax=Actinoalloteichus TaxID=65496 RepID=UPI00037B62B6|nr:VOC family protein [Actinoalloteichus spitiensis]AUS80109.1 glyoxalase/bleomycin resistance/dioxygenase family protein [Actinoalloteichus sp. AHMU CJ021]